MKYVFVVLLIIKTHYTNKILSVSRTFLAYNRDMMISGDGDRYSFGEIISSYEVEFHKNNNIGQSGCAKRFAHHVTSSGTEATHFQGVIRPDVQKKVGAPA